MSRVTAPVAKLTRALSSAPVAARSSNPLLDSTTHNVGPALMPKYAELLRGRHDHSDSSRGLSTTHRPTPQPSISNRSKPLMQTFSSSAAPSAASTNIDATRLPAMDFETVSFSRAPRVPILPDNYSVGHAPDAAELQHVPMPAIVAVDPARVEPATHAEVEAVGLDGIELKFVHEQQVQPEEQETGMLRDLWKGMVDDILGPAPARKLT